MPVLHITTNQTIPAEDRSGVLLAASTTVSEMLGKPESYVMVHLEDCQDLSFGGTSDPTCIMQLKSLGLPEEQTADFSSRLCDFADVHLSVEPDRTYIEFINPPRHMWGYDRHTFQR
ncbi:Macrophage migration inhibitory factor (MIF) [Alkalispirochaeta americana]|uniref:L-dopachrome isomerase n=1 Tax=Alkalispirochaeta americana TaxID=159291 RepID=A0A1N6P0R2_9SPIO|nr:phenylpyruvate tautomerase MIF-related protein [Alkalispirochaeta americana]SIP97988.1 Macrophage migration inhibitory factor (MIF) [Alkalispirochaeta americana]